MNPDRTLLFVGHPTEAVRKAKAVGLDVILLQHPSKFEQEQAELAEATFLVDYMDWSITEPLADLARQRWGFAAAVSLTDPGLEVTGRINDKYGLGGTGYEVSHVLRDKWAMRRRLAEAGARTIGAAPVAGRDSILDFGEQHGFPFILKPIDLAGGFGVQRVERPDDVDRVWAEVERMRRVGVDRGPAALFTVTDFLMEEYVSGPEFSIESFSFHGNHIVVSVTEKMIDERHFAELGHTVPARIDADTEHAIVTEVVDFLDVVGLKDGPSHTEVRLGKDGPVVIEGHNRIGGDRIMDLVRSAYDFDFVSYSVAWPFGLVPELTERPPARGGACVRFLHGPAGTVKSVSGIEELRERPEVIAADQYVQPGAKVGPLRDDFDRLGLVAVSGPDSEAAVQVCEELIESTVDIEIEAS
ncbi:ATP-grasp domain-containing protein [Lentzea nigeriaca]|uniref:ATP-grasp domain-containing protein n=1 Tax=Lentzea nigeriaca TaxID=1128665 RepID=UPI00195D3FD6|nr:ATP-grasp domain-containing protein [Lentzea nigeriaca]MBM7856380.1 carbamoylphosphate synthase large subunit [Lentzea nigeriaca]